MVQEHIAAFIDTTIGKQCIQILHLYSLHWVCVANLLLDKKNNKLHCIYDSSAFARIQQDFVEIAFKL